MRGIFGLLLMFLGVILSIGSLMGAFYLVSLGCAMNTTGCQQDVGKLFNKFIFGEGVLVWAIFLAGLVIVYLGVQLTRTPPQKPPRIDPPSLR